MKFWSAGALFSGRDQLVLIVISLFKQPGVSVQMLAVVSYFTWDFCSVLFLLDGCSFPSNDSTWVFKSSSSNSKIIICSNYEVCGLFQVSLEGRIYRASGSSGHEVKRPWWASGDSVMRSVIPGHWPAVSPWTDKLVPIQNTPTDNFMWYFLLTCTLLRARILSFSSLHGKRLINVCWMNKWIVFCV